MVRFLICLGTWLCWKLEHSLEIRSSHYSHYGVNRWALYGAVFQGLFRLWPSSTILLWSSSSSKNCWHFTTESLYIIAKYLGLIYYGPNTFRKWRKKITKLLVWFTATFMLIALPLHYLVTLYKMLICPLFAWVWIRDPTSSTLISFIKSTQHRALKPVSKSWSTDYSSLLSQFCLSTLKHRRKIAKVTIIFKLKLNLLHLPNSPQQITSSPTIFPQTL